MSIRHYMSDISNANGDPLSPSLVRRIMLQNEPWLQRNTSSVLMNQKIKESWLKSGLKLSYTNVELDPSEPATMAGLPIKVDDSIPPGEVRFIDKEGFVCGKIFNIGSPINEA